MLGSGVKLADVLPSKTFAPESLWSLETWPFMAISGADGGTEMGCSAPTGAMMIGGEAFGVRCRKLNTGHQPALDVIRKGPLTASHPLMARE